MARFATASDLINRTAVECGLLPSADPVGDPDETFLQLVTLANGAGQELIELHPWEALLKDFSFVTQPGDDGSYNLPDDFAYMIDQTGWDRTNRVPVGGPLSQQDWAYLVGRGFASTTIYVSFQLSEDKFQLFPQPDVPEGLTIQFKYMGRNWVLTKSEGGILPTASDKITASSDVILYEPILFIKFLKCKFLEAKGFDTTAARMEFENMFNSRIGKDTGAPILNAGNTGRQFPYITPWYNTPDTGYGGVG